MMNLNEIAKTFETTGRGLAEILGYTTQGMYKAVQRTPGNGSRRRIKALLKLADRNLQMYMKDLETAEKKRIARETAIRELEILFQVRKGASE